MTTYYYDPVEYLTSTQRAIQQLVTDKLVDDPRIGDVVDVEMSFPERTWSKTSPLTRSLVHFELDDDPEMRLGFGVPTTQEDDEDEGTTTLSEPACHLLNFDVGIWTSAQSGGTPKRAQIREVLYGIFGPAGSRRAFTELTNGLVVTSYDGGSDVLDRVNDLPVYRTTASTLIVSVFSKHVYAETIGLVGAFDIDQKLSITGADGSLEHINSDGDPWT